MNVLIIGAGLSGNGARRLATALGDFSQIVTDREPPASLSGFDLAVVSPGVRMTSPLLQQVKAAGIEIVSELEYGFRHFPGMVAAITGTNGKTTTTELTAMLLESCQLPVVSAGNIGLPLSEVSAEILEKKRPENTVAVVEVSSFQLEYVSTFAPEIAVFLNLESDHIDRYAGGFEEYRAVKMRIFDHVTPENRIFGRSMAAVTPRRVTTGPDGMVSVDCRELIDFHSTKLRGEHNLENLEAALELCVRILPEKQLFSADFCKALLSFSTGRHRLERVGERDGVAYVNDSKATNPASVIAALKSLFPHPAQQTRLILGGLDKSMDFSPLADFLDYCTKCYLIGEAAPKIAEVLNNKIEFEQFPDFPSCLAQIQKEALHGETVLLSPGCASMDMFRDYKDRGDSFIRLAGFAEER